MDIGRSCALLVLVTGCARPSLDRTDDDLCGAIRPADASVGPLVLEGVDAGVAALIASPADTSSCRSGVYRGRFSCGGADRTLTGTVALSLMAVGSPVSLRTDIASTLVGADAVVGGRLDIDTQGAVDCATGTARFEMAGEYTVSCIDVPLIGEMTGLYDATHNVLRGRIVSLRDRDRNLVDIAADCVWCASADPLGENCL